MGDAICGAGRRAARIVTLADETLWPSVAEGSSLKRRLG
jgi:hypothetical protein